MSNVIPLKSKGAPLTPKEEELVVILRGAVCDQDTGKPCSDEELRGLVRKITEGMARRGHRPPSQRG